MKHRLGKVLPLAVVLATGSAMPAQASTDFWDCVITNITTSSGVSAASGRINGAYVTGSWVDLNGDGKFGPDDTLISLNINDRNNVPALNTPQYVTTRDELQGWARENAIAILHVLFPSGVSEITGASDDNLMSSATVSNNLFTKTLAVRPGATPSSLGDSGRLNSGVNGQLGAGANGQSRPGANGLLTTVDGQRSSGVNGQSSPGVNGQLRSAVDGQLSPGVAGQSSPGADGQLSPGVEGQLSSGVDRQLSADATGPLSAEEKEKLGSEDKAQLNSEVKAQLEYLDLKVTDNKGNAVSMVLGYATEADSGLNFSLTVPYIYSSIKDDIDSKSHFIGLDMALKYPVKKWDSGNWKVGGALFGSAFYLKTDTIEKSGNLKYGWGVFSSATHNLGFGTLGIGVDYRIAKAYLPSSLNSDNTFLVSAVNYINNLDPVRTLSYGCNFGVPFIGNTAAVNLEIVRSRFSSSDIPDSQKYKTTANLSGTYFPSDTFELNLGVRYDFELDNVKTLGVMLGVAHQF